jgi:hypothetical protein
MAFSLVLLRKLLFLIRPYPDVENVCINFEIIVLKNLINLFKITLHIENKHAVSKPERYVEKNISKIVQYFGDLTRSLVRSSR